MADFAPIVGALYDVFAPLTRALLRVAVRAIAGSMAAMGALAIVLGVMAYELGARSGSVLHGVIAVVVAAATVLAAAPVVVVQRAIGRAVVEALSLGVAPRLVALVFDGLFGVEEGEAGERGSKMQRHVERLPLAELELRGKKLVARLGSEGGFVLAHVRKWLVGEIERVTLESLRADSGGLDLVATRAHVEVLVAGKLAARVNASVARKTTIVVGLAIAAGLGIACLLGR